MIVDEFLNIAKKNKDKLAFVKEQKTYQDLLNDLSTMIEYFQKELPKNLPLENTLLLLVPLSYQFYVSFLASIIYGVKVVIIDNFKDLKRVNQQIIDSKATHVLVNHQTKFLKEVFKPLKTLKMLKIPNLNKVWEKPLINHNLSLTKPCLVTYTSGGTNKPKAVNRSLEELTKQIKTVEQIVSKIEINKDTIVLAMLPVYTLLCLSKGLSILLIKKQKIPKDIKPTIMFSSIAKALKFKKTMPCIKTLLIGGSFLSYHNALRLKELFPKAKIIYIYGATEAALISSTTVDEYLNSLKKDELCLGSINQDVNIRIEKMNESLDYGEIIVSSDIITNNYLDDQHLKKTHPTKDLGYIKNQNLYLVGRIIDQKQNLISNYLIEHQIKKHFPEIKNIAILEKNKIFDIYLERKNKKLEKPIKKLLDKQTINFHYLKKIPLDYRHQIKIDYRKLLEKSKI